ncbi:integrase [Streptosporangium album]|uniref:Integrase n=1 Tax=Streptosporangium album TaxID=47479 RepID=A0A7W7WAR7_9ACTN|nr:tyrosine-type recombinase/integrase [Streptosporangium album]MBB4939450.1 integrase [Streptosporangium album]
MRGLHSYEVPQIVAVSVGGSFGNPSDPGTFSHLFSRPAQKAGLGHWHPHELRHSGTSLMLAQGTPLHVVHLRYQNRPTEQAFGQF